MSVSPRRETQVAGAARVGRRSSLGRRLAGSGALVVVVLMVVGVAIRVAVAGQSLIADELSTYWIVSKNGLADVVSAVHGDAEITPPLYFVAAWLAGQIDLAPEFVRGPSLVAGAASIPVIYFLGLRTVGRPAALVAAGLTALSPFMIHQSTEARGYALMMLLVMLSSLAMLVAVDKGRVRWWVAYAAASCAAVYTHYTCVFALGAQLLWVLWAHPEARRPALMANLGGVVAFLPWVPGVINDLDSPTTDILSAIYPFSAHELRLSLEHWAIGDPYSRATGLREFPGTPALALLWLALIVAIGGVAVTVSRERPGRLLTRLDRRMALILALAFSVPIGEAVFSAVGTNLFATRNLAAAWPAFALAFAALLSAAGPRLRFAAAALAIASFALGAAKMLEERFQRPDYRAAASFIDGNAEPADVVIDNTFPGPGPYTPLDVALQGSQRVFRGRSTPRALAAAAGGRIFVVGSAYVPLDSRSAHRLEQTRPKTSPLPARYRFVETRAYPGTDGVLVTVFADGTAP